MANTDIIIHDEKDNVGVIVVEKTIKNQEVIVGLWKMISQLRLNH